MENKGRESAKDNDLFFTCAFIDYIARKTKNRRKDVVCALGNKNLTKIYELADVYHSDNIERVSDDFIQEMCIRDRHGGAAAGECRLTGTAKCRRFGKRRSSYGKRIF